MKYTSLVILLGLFLNASCEKVVQAGNTLNQVERDYLAQQQSLKCKADSTHDFDDFTNDSNLAIVNFDRDQAWKYEYKKDSTVVETTSLSIWKVTPAVVAPPAPAIVYLRLNLVEGGISYNKFIKITTADNSAMIAALKEKKCSNDKNFTMNVNTDNPTATKKEARVNGTETNTFVDSSTVSHFKHAWPAYFGSLDYIKTNKTVDNHDAVKKTETYTFALTDNSSAPDQDDNYTTFPNRQYCVVVFATPNTYTFPFVLKCEPETAASVDGDGDGTADFAKTELVL